MIRVSIHVFESGCTYVKRKNEMTWLEEGRVGPCECHKSGRP
jgi:hypothetical protein